MCRLLKDIKVPNVLVGIRTGNGEIYTGYYEDLFQLLKADQAEVWDKRKQVGQTAKGRGKNTKNLSGMPIKAIKAMKAKMKAQTITISDMKAKFDVETNNPVTDDADYSFGGRKENEKSKKRRTKYDSDNKWLAPLLRFWINLWDWLLYFICDRGGAIKPWRKIYDFNTSCRRISL